MRIDERKEVVHEVDVQRREELVLRDERCELVRVLDLENGGEDEHAADANAAERFESANGEVSLNLEGGKDESAGDDDCAHADVDVVAVRLGPFVQQPFVIREREERFRETDFGNAHGDEERCDKKKNARNDGLLEILLFKTIDHGCSLQNVCRFFEDFLGAYPIDGLGVFDADVVYDGKDDAESRDAEQDNPI